MLCKVLCIFLFASSLEARVVVLRSHDTGMFSIFHDVLALVQAYENGDFCYAEVDVPITRVLENSRGLKTTDDKGVELKKSP